MVVREEKWKKSQCLSGLPFGGPWKRGELPACDHFECVQDGDGESIGYRFAQESQKVKSQE